MAADLPRRIVAEALGTAMLVATVVGSGIMADRLTDDAGLALLGNTLPTGAILVVLITILGPISGAHFNPAVTLVFALRREIDATTALAYIVAQIVGGVAGTLLAHAMFELPIFQISQTVRTGNGQWIAELVAAFGLVFTILAGLRFRSSPSLGSSGSTSPRPIGSRLRRRLPIQRSPLRGRFPTHSRASGRWICRRLSSPNFWARCLPWPWQDGCSPSLNQSDR